MKTVQIREAKAGFAALVAAAEKGEPTTITRHGRPSAVLVSIEDAKRLYPDEPKPSLADYLLNYPGGFEPERDRDSALRDAGL